MDLKVFKVRIRADLHGTIFVACDNGLRQAHDKIYDCCVRQKKCRSILKHVLKRFDNRKSCRRPVASLSHATKIVLCKSALRLLTLFCRIEKQESLVCLGSSLLNLLKLCGE